MRRNFKLKIIGLVGLGLVFACPDFALARRMRDSDTLNTRLAALKRLLSVYQFIRGRGINKIVERDILGDDVLRDIVFNTRTNRSDF